MARVVVLVQYPLPKHSRTTLEEVVYVSRERGAELTVLHVDLYQLNRGVAQTEPRRAVEAEFGPLVHVRYVVCRGFLVKETIFEEVAAEEANIVVIGSRQTNRWRRTLRRFLDDPDIDVFLREKLGCAVITVRTDN